MSRLTRERAIETVKYAAAFNSENSPLTEALQILIKSTKELQHYKDLEEQGRLIELPCKVGDELYVKHRTFKDVMVKGVCIGYTWWRTDGFCVMFHSDTPTYGKVDIAFSEFGKTVFPTKEEAEAKLKELQNGR